MLYVASFALSKYTVTGVEGLQGEGFTHLRLGAATVMSHPAPAAAQQTLVN